MTVEDIAYAERNGRPLLGRLYRPPADGPHPFVVDVHGGAWVRGDRLDNARVHAMLAAAGIGVFAIDFRMPPRARYPTSMIDINTAIRWFRSNLRGLQISPTSVGGLGWSSGGHQVVLTALCPDEPVWAQPGGHADLDFVVACWPILDPLARYRMALAKPNPALIAAHLAYWPHQADMAFANPQGVLDRGAAIRRPPMLIIQGTADDYVDPRQSSAFTGAYRRAGGKVTLLQYEGAVHGFINRAPESVASRDAIAAIVDFIRDGRRR